MEDNDMNVNWFKNPDNVVYADVNQFCDNFGIETGIENLREKLDNYRANPVLTQIGRASCRERV